MHPKSIPEALPMPKMNPKWLQDLSQSSNMSLQASKVLFLKIVERYPATCHPQGPQNG